MDVVKLREYEALSPFEIKDFLAKSATSTAQASAVAYLNAGWPAIDQNTPCLPFEYR